MATLQRELDAAKKRRDALRQQVKSSEDNKDKQKKAERRRRRKKENSFTQLIPVFVVVLVVLVWCAMQDILWGGSIELVDVTYGQPNSAQSQFVAQYLSARQEADKREDERKQYLHNGEWEVTGTGDDRLDELLTIYNTLAYHYDEVVAEVISKDPSAVPLTLPADVDLEVYALSILGTSLYESSASDTVESWGVSSSTWASLSDDQKIAALKDHNWLHDINAAAGNAQGKSNYVDSSGYARYANGVIANEPGSNGKPKSNGGYQRGNVVTGKDYYGKTVTIGGRWGYGMYQWTYGRRVSMANAWEALPYDMSTMYGQIIWSVAEGMNGFGGGMHRYQQAVMNECTRSNFPNGIWDDKVQESIALFWGNCVSGTRERTLSEANSAAERRARNLGIYGDPVHGSSLLWNNHPVIDIIREFSDGGVPAVVLLLSSPGRGNVSSNPVAHRSR